MTTTTALETTMPTPNPAALLATLLRLVAAHLDAHPHLPAVSISGIGVRFGGTTDLQIVVADDRDDELPGLVAWARSLGLTEVHVRRFAASSAGMARCHVHARGVLDGHQVDAWGTVHALDSIADDLPESGSVDLNELVDMTAAAAARSARDEVLAGAR